ncbi:hypothetical protein LCGC14_0165380 [marine sediment metagenome]|uniref:Uncharacterized protein n=1 Tax=marine sediment metagenome TaxID=412755 RepID=A0A0F9UYT6_9ZZZZ
MGETVLQPEAPPVEFTDDEIRNLLELENPKLAAMFDRMDEVQKAYLLRAFTEIINGGKSVALDYLTQVDYERDPVEIQEFMQNDLYLGNFYGSIWPRWRKEIAYICTPANKIYEVVFSGAIGVGKTTAAMIIMLYKIYRLSCLRRPAEFHGQFDESRITFGLYNATLKLTDVGVESMRGLLEKSPYFKEVFPFEAEGKDGFKFPKNIHVMVGSQAFHVMGHHLFGIAIDEMNFMRITKKQARAKKMSDKGQVHEMVNATARRLESRFAHRGENPGILLHLSSAKSSTSYLELRKKEIAGKPGVHIVDGARWEFQPDDRYTGAKFRFFVGNKFKDPKILTDDEKSPLGGRTIEIPVEHHRAFEEDPLGASRDIAGIATDKIMPFFPRSAVVDKALNKLPEFSHPFIEGMGAVVGKPIRIDLETADQIQDFIDLDRMFTTRNSRTVPRNFPHAPRYLHIDLGRTEDALGISMVHPTRAVSRPDRDKNGDIIRRTELIIASDFSIQIKQELTEIDWGKVREFVYWLAGHGFQLEKIGVDSPASPDTIQQLQKAGFTGTQYLSVDKKKEPYEVLKTVYNEMRLSHAPNEVLVDELLSLEDDIDAGKVDHPEGGSKDVADSLCGAVYLCVKDENLGTLMVSTEIQEMAHEDVILQHVRNMMTERNAARG